MPAAVYCRIAPAAPGESATLAAQEARCRAEATRRGLLVGHVYRDEGSGAGRERPGLAALRAAVARGSVSSVIVASHDRLAQDLDLYREVAGEWGRAGVALIIAGD